MWVLGGVNMKDSSLEESFEKYLALVLPAVRRRTTNNGNGYVTEKPPYGEVFAEKFNRSKRRRIVAKSKTEGRDRHLREIGTHIIDKTRKTSTIVHNRIYYPKEVAHFRCTFRT
jgi:hypothetical protein